MKRKKASAAEPITANGFQVGQIWKVGDENLVVTSLGKTLVHYKKYKLQPRGIRTTLSSKSDLEKLLRHSKAILAVHDKEKSVEAKLSRGCGAVRPHRLVKSD